MTASGPASPSSPERTTKRPRWRGSIVIALLGALLGTALVAQVRQNEKSGLQNLTQPDLIALLANVNDESTRLSDELDTLRTTKSQLASGGDTAAVRDAQSKLDQLAVLNGTKPVHGPGITLTVAVAKKGVTGANLLDAMEELRDAGAEAIDVGGHRVVANTWFSDVNGAPAVGSDPLPADFTITAIGDPHTMSTAMEIPGGVTDTLTQAGAHVKVAENTVLRITSVRTGQ